MTMAVKILTEESEKEVTFLKDAKVKFVSLVRHGANRMPFRIIKSEQKGGDTKKMTMVIQSILLPKGVKLADLSTEKDLGWVNDADGKTEEFDDYSRTTLIDVDKFDKDGLKMVKVHDRGVWVIAGDLQDGVEVNDPVTLGSEDAEKAGLMPTAPMDAMIGADEASAAAVAQSFRELFDRELTSMLDVVYGSLKQAAAKPKARKTAILNAVDAFRSFLAVGLDAIQDAAVKIEKSVLGDENQTDEGGLDAMFKDKDEFVGAVTEVVSTILDAREKKAKEEAAAAAEAAAEKDTQETEDKVEKTEDKSVDTELQTQVAAIAKSVKDLAEKVDSLGDQPASDAGTQDDDGEETKEKGEKVDEPETDKDGKPNLKVFGGLLTRKKNAA
jgi:hypothetical protein